MHARSHPHAPTTPTTGPDTDTGPGRRRDRALTLAALLVAAVLVLAGCGSSTGSSSSKDFDRADVSFAQQMIPHHRQAVAMADLAATRTSSPAVRRLAARIKAGQGPEITTMTGWLRDWHEKVPARSSMTMSGGAAMPGMMSGSQLTALRAASGARFDRMFLTEMTRHHQGAVAMARTEQASGRYPAAVGLAGGIEKAQTSEIATMRRLLTR